MNKVFLVKYLAKCLSVIISYTNKFISVTDPGLLCSANSCLLHETGPGSECFGGYLLHYSGKGENDPE